MLVRQRNLDKYYHECAGLMHAGRFGAISRNGQNLVIYNLSCFSHETVLKAWKRQWIMLRRWYMQNHVDINLEDMLFVRCERELFYCRWLHDTVHTTMIVPWADPQLQCWFLDKRFTNLDSTHSSTFLTRALELVVCQRTAAHSLMLMEKHNLENIAVFWTIDFVIM